MSEPESKLPACGCQGRHQCAYHQGVEVGAVVGAPASWHGCELTTYGLRRFVQRGSRSPTISRGATMCPESPYPSRDFRRQHIAEWTPDPWVRIAHEAWEDYDREASLREIGGPPPKFNRFGLPSHIRGFGGLFADVTMDYYERARQAGFDGSPEQWWQEVKRRGK